MRVFIIQFLPGYTDFLEHFGELLALVVGEGTKGLLSKANAGRLVDAGVFPAGFGQANGELPSILGVTAALDEAVELELGQDLGKRPRLEVKVHAEFLLRHLAAGLLGQQADDGRLAGYASAMKMHVMAAKAQAAQDALGEFVFGADRFGYVYRLRRVTAGLMRKDEWFNTHI